MVTVQFTYLTGLKRHIFRHAKLKGSWDAAGKYAHDWTEIPMQEIIASDGCPAFTASVSLDETFAGTEFQWGVLLQNAAGTNIWGITTETPDYENQHRYRVFTLGINNSTQQEKFYFTYSRWLGAQKVYLNAGAAADIRFALWAPNALAVDIVFASPNHGFIDDHGNGMDASMPVIAMHKLENGIFESDLVGDFTSFVGKPYMFRIKNAQGQIVFRTDIHSRWQIGRGNIDPRKGGWNGDPHTLDGSLSCSVVIDQDVVRKEFEPTTNPPILIQDEEFWQNEFTPGMPIPTRLEDLVIYELHIGSLGFGSQSTGTLADAMALLDYLSDLGVNAIELLPVSEFSGDLSWGYGDTHHFVIESSAGGRDKYKHFVRECHRRGIVVIQDVVYNHYDYNSERAQWQYDSLLPEDNIYYWYEGKSADYPRPEGGYLDNGSSGFAPRYWEEQVRQLFISSAAEFIEEFHVDGLRVDLTQAIHRDNSLHANGTSISRANLFGQKFLREWSRTLRLIRPSLFLIAEDHSGWDAVTKMPHVGGLGFESTWFASFYHNLIGDSDMAGNAAKLIREAGFGHDGPLSMTQFSSILWNSRFNKVVYHESHDEAGNSTGSLRTSKVAVNNADLWSVTREFAEARCRVAFGLSMLSSGTPMFFMGEEIVAQKICKFNNILQAKEDLLGERRDNGAKMFAFYQDMIRLRRRHPAIRSHEIDIIHVLDSTRVLSFTRRQADNEILVVISLSNKPYTEGYIIQTTAERLPDGRWLEIFNSDAQIYGGKNIGNYSSVIPSDGGRIQMRLPANGFLVLQKY